LPQQAVRKKYDPGPDEARIKELYAKIGQRTVKKEILRQAFAKI